MLLGPEFTARNRVVLAHEQDSGRGLGCGLVEGESHQRFLALPDLQETFAQLACRGDRSITEQWVQAPSGRRWRFSLSWGS